MDNADKKTGAPETSEQNTDSESKLYHPLRWRGEPDPVKGWFSLGKEVNQREKQKRSRRGKRSAR